MNFRASTDWRLVLQPTVFDKLLDGDRAALRFSGRLGSSVTFSDWVAVAISDCTQIFCFAASLLRRPTGSALADGRNALAPTHRVLKAISAPAGREHPDVKATDLLIEVVREPLAGHRQRFDSGLGEFLDLRHR
jgi:hypothetical protein